MSIDKVIDTYNRIPEIIHEKGILKVEAIVALKMGVCIRPARILVDEANKYYFNIVYESLDNEIKKGFSDSKICAKSISSVMNLISKNGRRILITVNYDKKDKDTARIAAVRLYAGITTQNKICEYHVDCNRLDNLLYNK